LEVLDIDGGIVLKDALKKCDRNVRPGCMWYTVGEMRWNLIDTVTIRQAVLNGGHF